jgi:hypothetical protein
LVTWKSGRQAPPEGIEFVAAFDFAHFFRYAKSNDKMPRKEPVINRTHWGWLVIPPRVNLFFLQNLYKCDGCYAASTERHTSILKGIVVQLLKGIYNFRE